MFDQYHLPEGVLMSKAELERAQQLCEAVGVWLVVDNTYEDFTYDGREHSCVSGPNVINIFSMSKVCECFKLPPSFHTGLK